VAEEVVWWSYSHKLTTAQILWSQPEVLIYDREEHGGTSAGGYPDIIQLADGGLRVTSAQKVSERSSAQNGSRRLHPLLN